ncbi:GAP1-N2 domain-containing protein, partial [Actinoallomurus acaciae]
MAWDLRYTSVESGPTGRSGFQFVATTPGTPPDVVRAVTPYMSYRPPPSAPTAPAPDELAAFPVAFAYGREGDHAVLARCRYTGRDYSGRYGNFSGHAVVAAPPELEGLRPIELWESPVWDGPPEAVPDLVPGTAFDPDSLVAWLRREGAHDRLAVLLDAVRAALAGGHGRVVLVADDAGLVARWIALVSYSLPAALAADPSFITYTADPESAPQLVVGTVPEAWPRGGFRLGEPVPGDGERPGRFARVIADCWRTGDLDGIDAVGELLAAGPAEDATPDPGPDEG